MWPHQLQRQGNKKRAPATVTSALVLLLRHDVVGSAKVCQLQGSHSFALFNVQISSKSKTMCSLNARSARLTISCSFGAMPASPLGRLAQLRFSKKIILCPWLLKASLSQRCGSHSYGCGTSFGSSTFW